MKARGIKYEAVITVSKEKWDKLGPCERLEYLAANRPDECTVNINEQYDKGDIGGLAE